MTKIIFIFLGLGRGGGGVPKCQFNVSFQCKNCVMDKLSLLSYLYILASLV